MDKTAHATENATLILCGPASHRHAVILTRNGKFLVMQSQQYAEAAKAAGLGLADALDLVEEIVASEALGGLPQDIVDILENTNYPGRSVGSNELAAAGVNHSIEDDSNDDGVVERSFHQETISWSDRNGEIISLILDGELLGRREIGEIAPSQDLIEPLTMGEAVLLIKKFFPEEIIPTKAVAERSVDSYIHPMLSRVQDIIELSMESCVSEGLNPFDSLLDLLPREFRSRSLENGNDSLLRQEWQELWGRIQASVKRQDVGKPWSHQDRYGLGERHGVTDIMTELVIQDRTPLAMMEPDDLHEKEEEAREVNLYHAFYDQNGVNRGWSERSLYYARCKEKKEALYEALRDVLLRKPADKLKVYLTEESPVRKAYKKSVKACSPGPVKKLVDGRWVSLPLTGNAARQALLERGYSPEKISPNATFFQGERWHKLLLTKELLDRLEADIRAKIEPVPSLGSMLPGQPVTMAVPQIEKLKVAEKR